MTRVGWWATPGILELALGRPLYGRLRYRRRLRVKLPHLLRHTLIIGSSGSGKSRLLRKILTFLVHHSISFTLIDPAGDLYREVLSIIADLALPGDKVTAQDAKLLGRKLVLIEPDLDCGCVGFNLLQPAPEQIPYLVVDQILEILKQIWSEEGMYGPRLESVTRAGLMLLMEHNLSLLEMVPLLSSESFRRALVHKSKNTEVKMFFQQVMGDLKKADFRVFVESTRTRFEALSAHPVVRRLIGQTKSTVTFRQIIDGKWCLINLSGDKFKQSRGLLGALFIAMLHSAILSRENEPPHRRTVHILVADELPEFWQPVYARILTGSRKFGLGSVSALQNLTQPPMAEHPEIVDTLLSNTHTRMAFSVGRRDADRLAREFFLPTGAVPQYQPHLLGIPLGPPRQFWSLSEEIENCAQQLCHQRVGEAIVSFKGTRDPRPFVAKIPHVPDIDITANQDKVELLRQSVAAAYYRPIAEIDADIQARQQRWQLVEIDAPNNRGRPAKPPVAEVVTKPVASDPVSILEAELESLDWKDDEALVAFLGKVKKLAAKQRGPFLDRLAVTSGKPKSYFNSRMGKAG